MNRHITSLLTVGLTFFAFNTFASTNAEQTSPRVTLSPSMIETLMNLGVIRDEGDVELRVINENGDLELGFKPAPIREAGKSSVGSGG